MPGRLTTSLRPGCRVPSGSVHPWTSSSVVIRRSSGQNVAVSGHLSQPGQPLKKWPTLRFRHFAGSVSSWTTVSIIESGAGSVAVSARPIFPWTPATSGNVLISLSVCWSSSFDFVTLIDGSVVGMYSRSPSSSGGMNSDPRFRIG
jgi:hypothetical protein